MNARVRLAGLSYDLRHAVRALRSGRASFWLTAASLALGIGINVAMFTMVSALLLRPLPVGAPESLYGVTMGSFSSFGWIERADTMNYPLWRELRDSSEVFSEVFAYAPTMFDTSSTGEARLVPGAYASAGMWKALGVPPVLGRTLDPADEKPGSASAVAVIGEVFWESEFGRDPQVIGRPLHIGGRPFSIVGVAPRTFGGMYVGTRADVYVPVEASGWLASGDPAVADGQHWWLVAAGRLRPGVTYDAGRRRLAAVSPAFMARTIPPDWPADERPRYLRQRFELGPVGQGFSFERDRLARPLLVASGLMGALLLLACVNIATLQLGRGLARAREFAMRLALGASRWRLGWQVFVENLLVAGLGAGAGLALASPATAVLASLHDTRFSSLQLDLRPDARVLAWTAALALGTAILSGLAPVVQAMRTDARGVLTSARGTAAVEPARYWLLALQVSLAVALGSSALLFGATLHRLTSDDKGFDASGIALLDVAAADSVPARDRSAFFERLLTRLSALPPVASAAASYVTPLDGATWQSNATIVGGADRRTAHVYWHVVTPRFFETYRTRIVAGRSLTVRDTRGSAQVVLVNQAFVAQLLDGRPFAAHRVQSGVGEAMRLDAEIVGIVADAKYETLRSGAPPTVYVAMAFDPAPPTQVTVALRARGSVAGVIAAVRSVMREAAPGSAWQVRPFEQQVADSVVDERAIAMMSGLFGLFALLLASLGIYGLTAYSVRQRRPEIGIRLALGATAGRIVGLLLTRTARATAVGAVCGVAMAYWIARVASALLYSVRPGSVLVYVSAVGVLALAAVAAVARPALRAIRIDPAETLRME